MTKIAIISTRLCGIDGVSIEAGKWAEAYVKLGFTPVYIAGNFIKTPESQYFKIKEMDYYHPEVLRVRSIAFNKNTDKSINKDANEDTNNKLYDYCNLKKSIDNLKRKIKREILKIIGDNNIKYLSIENALSIPLNIPLGIALSEIIMEKKIKTITRHHDFYWEREEFLGSNIEDILGKYFPPDIDIIKHVVINSIAQKSIYLKKKIKAEYIPNVFDFKIIDNLNTSNDLGSNNFRKALKIGSRDYLLLQPTRVIERKRIERSIELVEKLSKKVDRKIYLLISGEPEKDEIDYFYWILDLARQKEVNLILSKSYKRGNKSFNWIDIFKSHSIYDGYISCDLVTLPSDVEGFGNPVIEASAFKRPLFVNNYPVLKDMLKKGFDFILIDGKVDSDCIEKVIKVFRDKKYRMKMLENNFNVAKKFYSMDFLIDKLKMLLNIN